MQTDWLWGLAGGGLIGLAGAILLLGNGRIMGASGILGSTVDRSAGKDSSENVMFLAGLVATPAILALPFPGMDTHLSPQIWVIVVGGLLVGIGTRLANGCTSGHGVCGISRLSRRSIASTLVYVGAGVLTISLLRHVWGLI